MLIDKIHWLGHASFMVKSSKVVYFDPYKISPTEKADLILISHEHFDHCSPADIAKIIKDETIIITIPGNQSKLSSMAEKVAQIKIVKPGDKLNVDGIGIEVVAAYNTNKTFHPKSNEWVGFVVEIDGEKVYHAGDTDLMPEMSSVKCDIALLPVSGTYVMTAEEAANASKIIKPKIAVPMHYGDAIGTEKDALKFKSMCKCEVRILKKE